MTVISEILAYKSKIMNITKYKTLILTLTILLKSMNSQTIVNKTRMPVVFVGHGNPMNAIENNKHTLLWR